MPVTVGFVSICVSLAAGLVSSSVAFVLNRLVSRFAGDDTAVKTAPLIEEVLKSGTAYLLGSPIVVVHAFFGSVESVYDLWGSRGRALTAAGLGLLGHVMFGAITAWAWRATGSGVVGVAAGVGVHLLWNILVTSIPNRRGNR